ncbi:MAG TPA: MBL fold metallo-hydrolase RNA specificity domain-containing protein, partial [Candidatus Nanoarchaeia archaeon]|nr:MBL fold metallo-hydrolase RNA specificity domain-containing protein [Candidatus Nanoarchaeia archaeon]
PLIDLQEQESFVKYNEHMLRKIKAIPNDLVLDELGWTDKVRAIVIGHAHLDHVGGLPYLASRYPKAEIIATHFTMEVLNSILEDDKLVLHNKRTIIKSNSKLKLKGESGEIDLEFIHTTHSTIQCVFVVWHSKEGGIFYALDFKFDKHPIIGEPPNYSRLKELGRKKQIKCLVVDSLYADTERRTASERIARDLLEDALSVIRDRNSALFITTFSSHIARLKSIVEFGKKTGRQIVFMGRSLMKYVNAAKNVRECSFYHQIRIMKYRKQINSFLKKVEDERGKYLVVCTGHQGEKGAILDRIINDETPFKFRAGDNVIFSSSIIPVVQNINAREKMDKKLRAKGARIQTDIHVSGHGGREDLRDLVNMLEPGHIIPAHGSMEQEIPMVELAKEMGYKFQENVHLSSNGKVVKI